MVEVKPGYKQTEVGVIPEDWDIDILIHFWNVIDCKHITAKFIENGIPVASIKEVQYRYVNLSNAKQTTEEYYRILTEGTRKPQAGDLILSRNATIGEISQVANYHPKFAMGQDVCILRKKNPEYSTGFLQALFQSHIIGSQLKNLMVGSTFKRTNIEDIRNYFVPMPSDTEQATIATALSDADALIQSLERLIAKKRNIKQGAMQELLTGKRRLPGFKEEWKTNSFANIVELNKGEQLNKSQLTDKGQYPAWNGGIEPSGYTSKWNTEADTITISEGGNSCGFVNYCTTRFWCGGHCYALRILNQDTDKSYLYQLLKFKEPQIMTLRIGSGLPNIQKKNLYEFDLITPNNPKEQRAIATVLSDMDTEITALESKLSKARQIKQGMMQELLTGRIRLT